MSWQELFRVAIMDVSVPAVPVIKEMIGYPQPGTVGNIATGFAALGGATYTDDVITSLSRGISIGSSFTHRYNSLGLKTAYVVLGMPIGNDLPGTTNPLPAAAQLEQRYVDGTVVTRDLKHAIAQANRTPSTSGNNYGTAFHSDIAGPEVYQAEG